MTHLDQSIKQTPLWRFLQGTYRLFHYSLIAALVCFSLSILFLLYLRYQPLPPPDIPTPSKIYDDQGKVIDQIEVGERREYVPLKRLPQHLIQATLAAEDRTFYQHFGFSLRGIARALWHNLRAGEITQGASTITQQLARNLYLTQDRTWTRKLKEAVLTLQLELHYSKNEILEMYLNKINYGNGAYGIGRAAEIYFHKKAPQLTLAESAILVGIPRGPSYYSPYRHYARLKARQQHILNLMVKDGMISSQTAKQAAQTQIVFSQPTHFKGVHTHYFRDYVMQTAIHRFGLEPELVQSGGLHIYTTLNLDLQRKAEQAVSKYLAAQGDLQGALLSINPHNGYIRAMVGGKDYRQSQYNRVFAKRQPGSSFKPILYLQALQNHATASTQIMSQPTSFVYEGGVYQPANYRHQYPNRPITMREALARSDNIYAVSTILQTGMQSVIHMAHRMGIKSQLQPTPSLALGSYPLSPFELTEAYTTLAAGGIHQPLIGILRIVDREGHELFRQQPSKKRVISPAHTFILSHLLSSVLEPGGTAYRVRHLFHRPAAGKTGSTDWDGWMSGYTPDLVTTVWVGYDKGKRLPHEQARFSQYIWGEFMHLAQNHMPHQLFTIPQGVKSVYIDPETGYLATPFCQHRRLEYYVAESEPKQTCPLHPNPQGMPPFNQQDHSTPWWRKLWNLWQ